MEHLTEQHPDNKIYKCLTCIRSFPMQSMLTHHEELQADQKKSNKCQFCQRQFVSEKGLIVHIENTHTASKKSKEFYFFDFNNYYYVMFNHFSFFVAHLCPECGKMFTSEWNLRVHQKQHERIRPFQCEDCPASFHFQNALVRHSEIHQNKKYVCSICSAELRTLSSLYAHISTL